MPSNPVIVFSRDDFQDSNQVRNPYPGWTQVRIDGFSGFESSVQRAKLGLPNDEVQYVAALKRISKELGIETVISIKFPDGRCLNAHSSALAVMREDKAKELKAQRKQKAAK